MGARANLLNDENWQIGPALRFRFGRDSDVDNNKVALLDELDDAVEGGVFARYDFEIGYKEGDSLGFELQFLQDISGAHNGFVTSLGANYNLPINRKIRLGFDIGTSYSDTDYMESFYNVTSVESVRSGISSYNAGGGFTDASLGFNALYSFNKEWGLFTRVSYQRLLGDAADSSIVQEEGSANQFLLGAGISYRF